MADLELEFEDEEEEEEEEEEESESERPRRYRSESIFSVTKEDLILIMLTLFGGVLIGWYANKLLNKQHPFPSPFPLIHDHHSADTSPSPPERVQEREEHPPGRTREKHQVMKRRRGGYYVDKEGNAVMESPSVQENWIIKRGFDGTIIDAYKIDESIR